MHGDSSVKPQCGCSINLSRESSNTEVVERGARVSMHTKELLLQPAAVTSHSKCSNRLDRGVRRLGLQRLFS